MRGTHRIRKEIRKVRRHFVPGALVLMYHRVIDLENDPYFLAVSPANFRQQIEYIKSTCHIMPLHVLIETIRDGKLPNRAAAITFDDGYIDVLEQAYPILNEAQAPATVYITSGHIGSRREFWWDDLERLLILPETQPEILHLEVNGQDYEWYVSSDRNRGKLHHDLYQLVKPLKHEGRIHILDQLGDWAGLESNGRPQYRTMDETEVIQLAKDGIIEIGAHTVTHPMLSSLTPDDQTREIVEGRHTLEEIIGEEVHSFAYPYGKAEDFTQESVQIVRSAGFSFGCSSICGSVESGSDIFQLNRCGIHNWEIDTFIQHIEDFFISAQ